MRGFLEDGRFTDWIDKLRQSRNEVLNDEMLLDSARFGIVEGLEAGITTYADTCSSGVVDARDLGSRVCAESCIRRRSAPTRRTLRRRHARAGSAHRQAPPEQTDLVALGSHPTRRTRSPIASTKPPRFARIRAGSRWRCTSPKARPSTRSLPAAVGDFAERWRRRGIAVSKRARSPIELLDRPGRSRARTAAHSLRPRRCRRHSDHGAPPVFCRALPRVERKVWPRDRPTSSRIVDAGIRVGLGSDSVASNNRMDILDEARLAVLIQRAATERHDAFGAHQALELATIGGARALNLDSRVGSLEVGKDADLAAFTIDVPRTIPLGDPYCRGDLCASRPVGESRRRARARCWSSADALFLRTRRSRIASKGRPRTRFVGARAV